MEKFKILNRLNRRINSYFLRPSFESLKGRKDLRICEVGCYQGRNARAILRNLDVAELVLIDIEDNLMGYFKNFQRLIEYDFYRTHFYNNILGYKITIVINDSIPALRSLPDNYFDIIYLDTDHTYYRTKQEIEIALRKTNLYGIVAGHDFNYPTVAKAVTEVLPFWKINQSGYPGDWWHFK